jgi:endonuclease YncB( thermonuclease family)
VTFWPAPELGADEPLETLWDGGLLAYVDREGQRLNAELVRQSYAQGAGVPPHVRYQGLLLRLLREAREANRGLD